MDPEPFLNLSILSFLQPLEMNTIISLAILIGLLATSALISGAEVAFFSLSPAELEDLEQQNNRQSNLIMGFLSKPRDLLATILITNNFVNVGIIILSTYISAALFDFQGNALVQFTVQVITITFLLLIFGEVLPKTYANNKSMTFAKFMAIPLTILNKLFAPLRKVLVASTKIIDSRAKKRGLDLSVDDLSNALELTSDENHNREEKKILEGIVKFGATDVKQIMRSRVDVTAINIDNSFNQVLKIIKNTGFSRIPVFEESFDNVKGVLYIKDVLPHVNEQADFEWPKLLREVFYVPENKKIDDLLKEFQSKKIHLAIVVDEYGGTSGIVTLEDIIEEIVGDISDEFDDDNLNYSKLDKYNYVFEGKTLLNDFYRILDIHGEDFEEAKGESDTIAGFIIEITGKIPSKREIINFKDFTFTIEGVNKRRITRIKVTHPSKKEKTSNED